MKYWFFGCVLAALAGAGVVFVPHSMYYTYPELMLTSYF